MKKIIKAVDIKLERIQDTKTEKRGSTCKIKKNQPKTTEKNVAYSLFYNVDKEIVL